VPLLDAYPQWRVFRRPRRPVFTCPPRPILAAGGQRLLCRGGLRSERRTPPHPVPSLTRQSVAVAGFGTGTCAEGGPCCDRSVTSQERADGGQARAIGNGWGSGCRPRVMVRSATAAISSYLDRSSGRSGHSRRGECAIHCGDDRRSPPLSLLSSQNRQLLQHPLQLREPGLQRGDLPVAVLQLLIQPLDGGQGHPVGIH
jgi:hypothetical protein